MNDLQAMRQDPRFEVYKAQAETNWRENQPKYVALLEKENRLESSLNTTAETAVLIAQQAESQGLNSDQAEELVAEQLFPPSQDDQESPEADQE